MAKCDHDKRFSGVFFMPKEDHGCIACGFERLNALLNDPPRLRKYIEKKIDEELNPVSTREEKSDG